jgi:hypothetical protein
MPSRAGIEEPLITLDAVVDTNDDEDVTEYIMCGMYDNAIGDECAHVGSDESLCGMNLGDLYDDLIMPEPVKVEEEIVLAVMKFPNKMKMTNDPHISIVRLEILQQDCIHLHMIT